MIRRDAERLPEANVEESSVDESSAFAIRDGLVAALLIVAYTAWRVPL